MITKSKPLSWTAKRSGAIYCAPACGGGCTWAAYQKALADAKALARRLGPGWVPRVWENLGWHYSVLFDEGRVALYPTSRGNFLAYLHYQQRDCGGGVFSEYGRSPRAAIKAVLQRAQERQEKTTIMIKAGEAALATKPRR